jgi:gliding motility-associated-like protein
MVVKNSWGCADTVVRTVVVEPDFNVYVPTAFTPNADELNDVFQPKGSGVVKYSLIVYDRWGQKIFQSTDFSKGWDGTFKGEECKMDVYVWKIIASDIKGKTKNLNGSVTLYR